MLNWSLHDVGIRIEQACSIIGHMNPSAYRKLRDGGAFGNLSHGLIEKQPVLEVAAARSLLEAERSGMTREHALPFVMAMAEAAYLYLAAMQLGRRSWQGGGVPGGIIGELAQRLGSHDGLAELHERLSLEGRYDLSRPFALFTENELVWSASLPEPDHEGQRRCFVDIGAVARQIQTYAGRQLFMGDF